MTREEKAKAYADMICAEYPYEIPTLHSEVRQAYLQGIQDAEKEYSDRVMQAIVLLDPNFEQTDMFKNIQNKIVASAMEEIGKKCDGLRTERL